MSLYSYNLGNLLPLLSCRVHTGWVVCAGVEHHNTAFGGGEQGLQNAGDVETPVGGGEVRVALAGDSNIAEDLIVINPGRVGKVDRLRSRAGIESREKEGAEVDGASSTNGLHTGYLVERACSAGEFL